MASPDTKITILVDNSVLENAITVGEAPNRLASEHGLAFLIESGGTRILFDTGQGPSLENNIPALGQDLTQTDILVLSHGHYDHTGGVAWVLRHAPDADVYCHPGVVQVRYAVHNGKAKSIGIPRRPLKALKKLSPERLHWVQGPVILAEHVGITGPIPRSTEYEDTGGPFYLDKQGWRPDPLEDDLALWIQTEKGLVVCFGCAHSGAVNTLDYIRSLNRDMGIRAVIGGLHLINAGEERMNETIAALRGLKIPLVIPCHCTGPDALKVLAEALGDSVSPGASGMVFEV
jgi:7,8-dihydropterin-6-yl-methyl-4-(beta-D-ribofuranosyl)aminobenzene 5'-phosphate synthase